MAGQYSISKIDSPLYGTVLSFSEQHDFLAVALKITNNDVITSMLDLDNALTEKIVKKTITDQKCLSPIML